MQSHGARTTSNCSSFIKVHGVEIGALADGIDRARTFLTIGAAFETRNGVMGRIPATLLCLCLCYIKAIHPVFPPSPIHSHTHTMVLPAPRLSIKENDLAAQHFANELCTLEGSMQGVRFGPSLLASFELR